VQTDELLRNIARVVLDAAVDHPGVLDGDELLRARDVDETDHAAFGALAVGAEEANTVTGRPATVVIRPRVERRRPLAVGLVVEHGAPDDADRSLDIDLEVKSFHLSRLRLLLQIGEGIQER